MAVDYVYLNIVRELTETVRGRVEESDLTIIGSGGEVLGQYHFSGKAAKCDWDGHMDSAYAMAVACLYKAGAVTIDAPDWKQYFPLSSAPSPGDNFNIPIPHYMNDDEFRDWIEDQYRVYITEIE